MSESLGDAVLVLRTDQRKFDQGIDSAERRTMGLDARFKKLGQSLAGFGDKMTTRVSLPIAAVSIAAFKMAADADEASNKFEVVMGDSADAVRKKLKALEATIPLTTGEMLTLAAGVQDMVVPMGLARDEGAKMSLAMVSLAGDIAAFNDTTPAQVLDDMKSALAGSSEPLFKYGVDTRVAALEAVALKNGLIEQGEALDNAARSQAILLQIQAQSTDAMGAAAREASGASAQYRFLWRDVKQLAEEIGTTLIPIITPLIEKAREWLKWFRDLSPATQTLIVKAGLLFAALGPVLSITGRLISVGGSLAGVYKTLTTATALNTAATLTNAAAQKGSLASFLGFFTTMRQGRNSLGQFTTSMTGFQKFFSGPGSFAASFGLLKTQVGRMGTGIAGLGTKFLGLGSSIASTTGTVIAMANPWSLAVITVSALAGAIASYLAKEGGAIEQHFARTTVSVNELRGAFDGMATTAFERAKSMDFLGKAAIALDQAMRDGVVGAQEARDALRELTTGEFLAEEALGKLARQSNRAGDAARVLKTVLIEVSADMNAAAREATALAAAQAAAAKAAKEQAAAEEALRGAVARLGVTTRGILPDANQFKIVHTEAGKVILQSVPAFQEMNTVIFQGIPKVAALTGEWQKYVTSQKEANIVSAEFERILPGLVPPLVTLENSLDRFGVILPDVNKDMASLRFLMDEGALSGAVLNGIIQKQFDEYKRLGILTPELAQELRDMARETGVATVNFGDFFGEIRTGIPQVDSFLGKMKGFLGIFKSIVGVLGSASKGIGSFFSKIAGGGGADVGGGFNLGGLFGGGGGLDPAGFFGDTDSFLVAGQNAGTGILAGLKGIMGKVSNLLPIIGPLLAVFGGPLFKGIKAIFGKLFGGPGAAELEARKTADAFKPIFTALLTTQQLTEAGGVAWKQQNIAQRDIVIALGGSVNDMAGIWARFQNRAKDPAAANAFEAFWNEKLTAVQALMSETGMSLSELKNKAEADAKEAAASARAMVTEFQDRQRDMASSSISAAGLAAQAWEKSASSTVAAWKAARNATVGTSSILDIEELGSEAARRLGAAHMEAAAMTGDAWRENAGDIARVLAELETATGERRGVLDRLLDTLGHDGGAAFDIGRRGFDDDGRCIKLEVNSILDGDKVAESVVRKIPDVLDDAGLGC